MKRCRIPSADRLRELFRYEPSTGRLFRRTSAYGLKAGSVAGSQRSDGYRNVGVDGMTVMEHVAIWLILHGEIPEDMTVDHKDLRRNNNAEINLRLATANENLANKRAQKNNKLGVKGVCAHKKSGRYRAQIKFERQKYDLGIFDSIEAAQSAYAAAAIRFFGDFARIA